MSAFLVTLAYFAFVSVVRKMFTKLYNNIYTKISRTTLAANLDVNLDVSVGKSSLATAGKNGRISSNVSRVNPSDDDRFFFPSFPRSKKFNNFEIGRAHV